MSFARCILGAVAATVFSSAATTIAWADCAGLLGSLDQAIASKSLAGAKFGGQRFRPQRERHRGLAASTGRQVSEENEAWHNGAFTKAVVESLGSPGVKARADLAGSGGAQSPVMIRPATVPDFPLAVA